MRFVRSLAIVGGLALALAGAARAQEPASIAAAKPGEVRVLVSVGFKEAFETLKAQAVRTIGHPIVVQYGASRNLKETILSNQPFEVAIVTPEVLNEGVAKGRVRAAGRHDIATTLVALAQRGDVPKKDISTPEAFKTALLGAKAIRFAAAGSIRPSVDKSFAAFDPGGALQPRIGPAPGPQVTPTSLAPGEYELHFSLTSELLHPEPGWSYIGIVPQPLQVPVVMSAGAGVDGDAKAAQALIDFLASPAIMPTLTATRMTR